MLKSKVNAAKNPIEHVKKFLDYSHILYGDAYYHYSRWCKARGRKPVIKPAYGLALKELGWPKMDPKAAEAAGVANCRAKVGGKIRLFGMAEKPQPALAVVRTG